MTVRVLVVSALPMVRAGLEALIARNQTLRLVGSANGDWQMLAPVIDTAPDVVLLDVGGRYATLPGAETLALERQRDDRLHSAALVLLADAGPAWTVDALRAGARAVLPREAEESEILAAIDAVAAGLTVVRRDMIDTLFRDDVPEESSESAVESRITGSRDGRRERDGAPGVPVPSRRELQVLALLAEGLGNKQIAVRLAISEHTVKTHVASLFGKLGAYTRAEAVARGVRRGLILL